MVRASAGWTRQGLSVGLVPTMGALHEGHRSLIRRARRENDAVVVSIFVNPAQFGPREDFARYPRPFAQDRALCRSERADAVFLPSPEEMYFPDHETWVSVDALASGLCGEFRPGHFRGVATVVLKLLNLVRPTRAYFGRKDYQQLKVIERMVRDLNVPVKIVPCPTVREKDGLALSSRNRYLSPAERRTASRLPSALREAVQVIESAPRISVDRIRRAVRRRLEAGGGVKTQYVAVVDPETLAPLREARGRALVAVAAHVGKTRLIDNVVVDPS